MNRMIGKICLGLMTLVVGWFVGIASANGAPALVTDGKATGQFVLAADATQVEIFGVMDTRHWVEQITGVKVPVVSTPSAQASTRVYVGRSFAGAFTDDLARLEGTDGYAIRTKGSDVYVFGSRPRGTMYGVFALLTDNSDLIFARPNIRFGTVHGQQDSFTLEHADRLEIPVFWFRGLRGGYPPHEPSERWQMRMGLNNTQHNVMSPQWDMLASSGQNLVVALQDQYKDHPEYFALDPIKGGRKGVSHGEGTLCLSYPGLPEIWAKALVKHIRNIEKNSGRALDLFVLGPGDNWYCCVCDQCTAPIKLPDGSTLTMKDPDATKDPLFRSTQTYMFLNAAMKVLKQELPDVRIAALAYIYMAQPPAVEIDPDLLIYLAPYPTNTMHYPLNDPRQAAVWRERFNTWMAKTPTLGFYEYFYSKPSPLAYYAGANMRDLLKTGDPSRIIMYSEFDNDRGSRGIGENALGWDVGAMNTWVIARLMWNPNQDIDGLYREYIRRAYREAAPQMTQYYELIKKQWLDVDDRTSDAAHASIRGIYQGMIVKAGHEDKVLDLLDEAYAAAKNPNSQTLIRRMLAQYRSFSKAMGRLRIAYVPEMAHDGQQFTSVQWEKPMAVDDFKQTRRWGDILEASEKTQVKAATDGSNLYLRFILDDAEADRIDAMPRQSREMFPAGDRVEFWLVDAGKTWLFALDVQGNAYDSLNDDRAWDSGWRVRTQKTDDGWEAIAVIPLEALPLVQGVETKAQWTVLRTIAHEDAQPEHVSFRAVPLGSSYFPVEMDTE